MSVLYMKLLFLFSDPFASETDNESDCDYEEEAVKHKNKKVDFS